MLKTSWSKANPMVKEVEEAIVTKVVTDLATVAVDMVVMVIRWSEREVAKWWLEGRLEIEGASFAILKIIVLFNNFI